MDEICKKIGFKNWIILGSVGYSGGIWVFWNENLTIDIIQTNPHYLIADQTGNLTTLTLLLCLCKPFPPVKKRLWNDLCQRRLQFSGPWLSVGDYNETTSIDETTSQASSIHGGNADFTNWIFSQGLLYLGFAGPRFTWTRASLVNPQRCSPRSSPGQLPMGESFPHSEDISFAPSAI